METIGKIKQMITDGVLTQEDAEKYFPELKENLDEKVKRILHSISSKMGSHLRDIFTEEEFQCFDAWSNAYLEKQGKQETLCDKCKKEQPSHSCQDITALGRCAVEHEQNLTNKVEPKFKVGDIIRHKEQGFTCKISAVDTEYILSDCNGTHLPIEWQDAYELVEQNPVWKEDRSKELSLSLQIQAYLNIASDELYDKGKPFYSEERLKDIHKCMLMWQKLHNAYFYQNFAWSEEDDEYCQLLIKDIIAIDPLPTSIYSDCKRWLLSLKDRVQPQSTWKPSDEQIEALKFYIEQGFIDKEGCFGKSIVELYGQLTKLKGE